MVLPSMLQHQFTTIPVAKIGKKKEIPNCYKPNSYRVISEDAEKVGIPKSQTIFLNDIESRNILGSSKEDSSVHTYHRCNRPNPSPRTSHIRHNVMGLLTPICSVSTNGANSARWWQPSYGVAEPRTKIVTDNTTFRNSFRGDQSPRVMAKTNQSAARGIVPVNFLPEKDGSKRVYNETISMKQFNVPRADGDYQLNGKQKGAFVWNLIPKERSQVVYDRLCNENKGSEVFGRSKTTDIFPVRQLDQVESPIRSKTRSDTILGPIV